MILDDLRTIDLPIRPECGDGSMLLIGNGFMTGTVIECDGGIRIKWEEDICQNHPDRDDPICRKQKQETNEP
jgi:hypothetical protein